MGWVVKERHLLREQEQDAAYGGDFLLDTGEGAECGAMLAVREVGNRHREAVERLRW